MYRKTNMEDPSKAFQASIFWGASIEKSNTSAINAKKHNVNLKITRFITHLFLVASDTNSQAIIYHPKKSDV